MIYNFLEKESFDSYEDFKKNYKVNVGEHFNFAYDVVDAWAKKDKNKEALLYCDDHGTRKMYTFHDLMLWSNRAANFFLSHGIKKGDRVLMILKQRAEAWVCLLALHKIAAVPIPATFQLTPKDIIYRVNSANVKMIVSVDDVNLIEFINQSKPECPSLTGVAYVGDTIPKGDINFRKEVEAADDTLERIMNDNDDMFLMYFSSGTSGMPKMITHDFRYPAGHILTAKYWQHVEEGKLHLTVCDSGWAKFAWGKIYGQWICGAVIVAYDNEKFNPANMLGLMKEIKVTTFCAPPTIYRFLIKEDLSAFSESFSSIKHACIAGEPLNAEVYNKFKELTGLSLTEGFGQTETPVIIANYDGIEVKPGSTGKPSPDFDVDIVDENGVSCEDGVAGRIVIKNLDKHYPFGLFKGYLDDPDANAKAFRNNSYDTGDMAMRDNDGYFWFEGRSDDVIKCSGYRIGPFEVESAVMTHPSVLECAVTAAPDPVRGQVVKATIVLARGYEPSEELKKEIQNHVKHVTAPYKYPRIVEFVAELPKTHSGKIRRAEIRKNDSDK